MSIFSEAEIRRRQGLVHQSMDELDVDACFLNSADNVYYISGVPLLSEWGRPMWALLPREGDPTLIGSLVELETMQEAQACHIKPYADERNVRQQALSEVVAVLGSKPNIRRVGIEKGSLTLDLFEGLSEQTQAELVDVSALFGRARIVKSPEEMAILEVAAQVAKIGADAFLEALTPGNTELGVAGHAVAEMDRALGALYPDGATSSYGYCHVGTHTLTPHLHPTGRRARVGDLVALNVFPVVWGYCIELERTLVLGSPTDRQEHLLNVLDEAFSIGKNHVAPGVKMNELHAMTTEVIDRNGLGEYIRHGTGHAHGIMLGSAGREELGELRSYNDGVMQENMLNSIEPGFYIPEEGGFRHSDVMLVTDSGGKCLTEFPSKELHQG